MLRSGTALAIATILALILEGSRCQSPEVDLPETPHAGRELGFGTIRTLDGSQPWVGARVTLVHTAHTAVADTALTDRIEVVTDARGRYRADLLVGCGYTVSGFGEPREDGRYRRTRAVSGVVARRAVILEEQPPGRILHVRFDPHASWDGNEPLAVRYGDRVVGPHPAAWWRESDEAVIQTAPTPDEYEVFTVLVDDRSAHRAHTYGAAADVGNRPERPLVLTIPERRVLRTRIVDPDGNPVRGARTMYEGRFDHVYQGEVSDAEGFIEVVHASDDPGRDPYPQRIVVADGFAEIDFDRTNKDGHVQLLPGFEVAGRLTLDGEPLSALPVLVDASMGAGGGSWFGVDPRCFHTDGDGAFVVPGRQGAYPYRLTAILPPEIRARLSRPTTSDPTAPSRPTAATAVLSIEAAVPADTATAPRKLGDLELRSFRALDFVVTNPGDVPPGSVTITAIPLAQRNQRNIPGVVRPVSWPHEPVWLLTDRIGRVRMLVHDPAADSSWFAHVETAESAGWTIVEPRAKGQVHIVLDPRHRVSVRILGKDGKPLGNVSVSVVCPESFVAAVHEELLPTVRDLAMNAVFRRDSGRTGADGIATLVVPCVDATLDFALTGPDRSWMERVDVLVPAEREQELIELVVDH